jgi:hypothetical protein
MASVAMRITFILLSWRIEFGRRLGVLPYTPQMAKRLGRTETAPVQLQLI